MVAPCTGATRTRRPPRRPRRCRGSRCAVRAPRRLPRKCPQLKAAAHPPPQVIRLPPCGRGGLRTCLTARPALFDAAGGEPCAVSPCRQQTYYIDGAHRDVCIPGDPWGYGPGADGKKPPPAGSSSGRGPNISWLSLDTYIMCRAATTVNKA